MLQNKIKIYGLDTPTKHSSRSYIPSSLNFFNYAGTTKLVYYFTLPGFILGAAGLCLGFELIQAVQHGGNFEIGYVFLAVLLTLLGIFFVFIGILINSIAGLIRYRSNKF